MPRQPRPWFRRQTGWWMVQIDGKQVKLAQGKRNKALAQEKFHGLMLLRADAPECPDVQVASICEAFLDWSHRRQAHHTYRGYLFYVQSFCEKWGQVMVREVRPYHVTRWLDGNDWNDTTRYNAIRSVFRVFNWAAEEGLISANPLKGMKRPRPKSRQRYLTEDEYSALIKGSKGVFRTLLFAFRQTGGRPSELCELTWDQVHPECWILEEHKTADKVDKPRVIYLVTALRAEYSEDALIEAGVTEIDHEGRLDVRAKLNAPGKLVVILRDRQTGGIVDMFTDLGSVFEEESPIFTASAGEQLFLMPDDKQHEVLVAFSIEDLAVLRACGIPATLATGLDQMHPADVDRLCETFDLYRSKSLRLKELDLAEKEERGKHPGVDPDPQPPENAPMKKRLVLLGWSPVTLDVSPPAGFDAVSNHLRELNEHMGLELFDVCVWLATPTDVDRLRFFMRYEDVIHAREALLDGLYDGERSLEYSGKEKARQAMVPRDLPSAVLRLREAMLPDHLHHNAGERQQQALRQVERLLHEQVVGPMMTEAMEAYGATERAIGLAAAQLVQMFLTESMVINARMAKMLSEKEMSGLDAIPLEQIKELLKMGDRVAKFFREFDRCKQSTMNVIQVTAATQLKPLALPDSA